MVAGRRSDRLSHIPEHAKIEARLFFTLIGPGAWRLAERLTHVVNEHHTVSTPRGRFHFLAQGAASIADHCKGKGARVFRSRGGPVLKCNICLDEEELQCSSVQRSSLLGADLRKTNTSIPSTCCSERSGMHSKAVTIRFFPVERFHEDLPPCRSPEAWRHSCTVFLVDPRQDEADEDMLPNLDRRRLEVKMWMDANQHRHGPLSHRPLSTQVLIHRTPEAWSPAQGSPRASQILPSGTGDSGRDSANPVAESRYAKLLDSVQEMASAPEREGIRHFCNFDDASDLLRCHKRIAHAILEALGSEGPMLHEDSLEQQWQKERLAKQHSCRQCALM